MVNSLSGGPVPDDEVRELVDTSYDAIVATPEEPPSPDRLTVRNRLPPGRLRVD
jgi:predicted DNA-binding protein (MmcQ/YjbR family)